MRRLLPAAATVVGVAVAMRVVFNAWYLNYDARYAMLWARDVSRGLTPDYEAPFAPTPHPLSTLWSGLTLPFGTDGGAVIVWLTLLGFGLLVYLAYRLGAELFSPAVGVICALVVVTRPAFERDALLAYQDVPFAVLIVLAALLEARRPRRGAAVLAVLAVAGLLRPEAWVLAGLYWLYVLPSRSWRERARLAGLVAAAPVLWALMDLIVTGDPLHSLHGTAAVAEVVGRRRDVADAPYWTVKYFAYTLREPLGIGIPIGMAFAYRHRDRFGRGAALVLAGAAAMTLVFAINPVFGLPLIDRYVRTPSVLLAVFFGVALAGWALLEPGRERRVWQGLAALTAVVFVAFVPSNVDLLRAQGNRVGRESRFYSDLRAAGRDPGVRALAQGCGPLFAADHRPIAHLRYWLDGDPGSVATVEGRADPRPRVLIVPKDNKLNRLFFRKNFPPVTRPPGTVSAYDNRTWRVWAQPSCLPARG